MDQDCPRSTERDVPLGLPKLVRGDHDLEDDLEVLHGARRCISRTIASYTASVALIGCAGSRGRGAQEWEQQWRVVLLEHEVEGGDSPDKCSTRPFDAAPLGGHMSAVYPLEFYVVGSREPFATIDSDAIFPHPQFGETVTLVNKKDCDVVAMSFCSSPATTPVDSSSARRAACSGVEFPVALRR